MSRLHDVNIDPTTDPIFVFDREGLEALPGDVKLLDRDLDSVTTGDLRGEGLRYFSDYAPYLVTNPEVLGEFRETPAETYCVKDSEGDWWVSNSPETGYTLYADRVERGNTDLDDVTGTYGIDAGEPAPLKVGDEIGADDYDKLPRGSVCVGGGYLPVFKDERDEWQIIGWTGRTRSIDPHVNGRYLVHLPTA